MSEQLVVWEELAQVSSNDSSSIELPIFMRDVETLDGEELFPEYGGVSIKRNIRFPIRVPLFERLTFYLQTVRFPIPNSHINFSLLTKNSEIFLGLENVAGVLKPGNDDIYRITDHRIRAVDGVKCHFGFRYSYTPRWELLSRYVENIDGIFLEGLQLRKNNKLQFDENRLIVRSKSISTRFGHARAIIPICFSTPISIRDLDEFWINMDPSVQLSGKYGEILLEFSQVNAILSMMSQMTLARILGAPAFLLLNCVRQYKSKICLFSHHDKEKTQRRAVNLKIERFSTHQNFVTQKAVTMKSPKTLEFISGALELESTYGRAASQATGVKLTYMWHLGTAQFFDAVKVSYYGGCGKHSFEIPVFFDYSPLYLLSPENALTGIIAPFLIQIGLNQLFNSWRRKKRCSSSPPARFAEVLTSKRGDSTLPGDFKLISAVVNDEIDVSRPLSEILEYSKVLNCHRISSLPGFHGLDQLEGKHFLKISIVTNRGRFILKIPDGAIIDLSEFC